MVLVNSKAFTEQIRSPMSEHPASKYSKDGETASEAIKVESPCVKEALLMLAGQMTPALSSSCLKRQQVGGVFTPLGPAVKGGWRVSQYLAELPASVCGCVTFIANLLTALMISG